MIVQEFSLSCGWDVCVYYGVDMIDREEVCKSLKRIGCITPRRMTRGIGKRNTGMTYSNNKKTVMVIGVTDNAQQFANSYDHEKGHLLRHISQELGIEPWGEDEQYLSGEISQKMFPVAKRFLCDCCREKATKFFSVFNI